MFRHFRIIVFFNILFADVRHLFLCQTLSFGLCGVYCYFLTTILHSNYKNNTHVGYFKGQNTLLSQLNVYVNVHVNEYVYVYVYVFTYIV
jgi:hypothetical protein